MAENKKSISESLREVVTFKNFVCSGLPGMVEITANMPLITGLNMLITKGSVDYNLKALYRGWTITAIPFIPYNFVMFSAKNVLYNQFPYKVIENGMVTSIKPKEAVLVGGIAGIMAGMVATPIERIQVYQNARGVGLGDAIKEIMAKQGAAKGLTTGLIGTCGRDFLFTTSLFSVSDLVDSFMKRKLAGVIAKYPKIGDSVVSSTSRLISGSVFGFLTVPFNNIRIYQQGLDAAHTVNFFKATQDIAKRGELFSGWQFRVGRMALAIFYLRLAESAFMWFFRNKE